MRIDTLIRHFREAYNSVWRNGSMSFAALGLVAATLFIFGIFFIVAFNARYIAKEIDKGISISVSIKRDASSNDKNLLLQKIAKFKDVKKVEFISKEQGLKEVKKWLGKDDQDIMKSFEGKDQNVLPDVLRVTPKDSSKLVPLSNKLSHLSNIIDQVEPGRAVTRDLAKFSTWIQSILLIFFIVLAILSAFQIANTIKLNILARKEEIEIQRLIGASNWFIRWPFFIEGAFMGGLGALLPVILVSSCYALFMHYIIGNSTLQYGIISLVDSFTASLWTSIFIILLGIIIGIMGSMISVRRFLKI